MKIIALALALTFALAGGTGLYEDFAFAWGENPEVSEAYPAGWSPDGKQYESKRGTFSASRTGEKFQAEVRYYEDRSASFSLNGRIVAVVLDSNDACNTYHIDYGVYDPAYMVPVLKPYAAWSPPDWQLYVPTSCPGRPQSG